MKTTTKKKKTAPAKTKQTPVEKKHRIYTMTFSSVYPLYIAKAERKGRKKAEVDTIIYWLTGYSPKQLKEQLKKETNFETFFAEAPKLNPARSLIKGTICGVRIEEIEDPLMREVRYLDKLVDELAMGKAMEKILRSE
jgi:hypothetical protein